MLEEGSRHRNTEQSFVLCLLQVPHYEPRKSKLLTFEATDSDDRF